MKSASAPGIFFRGVAMGMADLIPGVSGGTVALISGIYPRLLAAITACNMKALHLLLRGQWRDLWQHVDGAFLLPLILGIGTAIITLAGVLKVLLETQALLVWSFFFGLVWVSSLYLIRDELGSLTFRTGAFLVAGIAVMLVLGLGPGLEFPRHQGGFFAAGMLGICAMILPGISGSFILVMLGMYSAVIAAVVERDLGLLLFFGLGCASGLMAFSRILVWILERARGETLALLVGFLLGSLVILWPWQQVVETVVDGKGGERPLRSLPVLPHQYDAILGDSQLIACLLSAIAGGVLIVVLHRLAQRSGTTGRAGAGPDRE